MWDNKSSLDSALPQQRLWQKIPKSVDVLRRYIVSYQCRFSRLSVVVDSALHYVGPVPVIQTAHEQRVVENVVVDGSIEAQARSTVDWVDQSRSRCAPDIVAVEITDFSDASSRCFIPEGNTLQLVSGNSAGCNPGYNPL